MPGIFFFASPISNPFQGSPNVAITAIDTSGGIASSRTSGQLPFFVQVSASAITATGTSIPYEDLEFQWDFGDPLGAETFTNPAYPYSFSGSTVNANNGQYGPEAAYVYRTAGTKTITLTVRGKNGSSFTTASQTLTVTASAFNHSGGEFWFDQVNGSDANNGTSSGTPKQSLSALNALIGSNKAFHLAKGSHWTGSTGILIPASGAGVSGVRFDAYGSGADPIVEVNAAGVFCFGMSNGGASTTSNKDDIVVSGIKFTTSGTSDSNLFNVSCGGNATGTITNAYVDKCTILDTTNIVNSNKNTVQFDLGLLNGGTGISNVGIWGGSVASPLTPATGGNHNGIFGGGTNWTFFVGFPVSGAGRAGAGVGDVFDHHIYPDIQTHGLLRWINFGSGPQRNYCANTNWDRQAVSGTETAQYHCYSENYFSGTLLGHDASSGNEAPAQVRFQNFVSQQNVFTGLTGAGALYGMTCAQTMTVRDSTMLSCGQAGFFVPNTAAPNGGNGTFLTPQIYRNTLQRTVNPQGVSLLYTQANAAINVKWTVTDNSFSDTFTAANVNDFVVASFQSASALIDRNKYHAPNDTDAKYVGSTPITFAAWQADGFDVNGNMV